MEFSISKSFIYSICWRIIKSHGLSIKHNIPLSAVQKGVRGHCTGLCLIWNIIAVFFFELKVYI